MNSKRKKTDFVSPIKSKLTPSSPKKSSTSTTSTPTPTTKSPIKSKLTGIIIPSTSSPPSSPKKSIKPTSSATTLSTPKSKLGGIVFPSSLASTPSPTKKKKSFNFQSPKKLDSSNVLDSIESNIDNQLVFQYIPKLENNDDNNDEQTSNNETISTCNSILDYIFKLNEPVTIDQLLSINKKVKQEHINDLVQLNLIKEIPIMNQKNEKVITLYTSITWFKSLSFINNIELQKIESSNNSSNNNSTAKAVSNHLNTPKKSLKRKNENTLISSLSPTLSNQKNIRETEDLNNILDNELNKLANEKKRLLKSIQDKKNQLEQLKEKEERSKLSTTATTATTTKKPTILEKIKKQKRASFNRENGDHDDGDEHDAHQDSSNQYLDEKRLDVLTLKWKKISQNTITSFHEFVLNVLKLQENDGLGASMYSNPTPVSTNSFDSYGGGGGYKNRQKSSSFSGGFVKSNQYQSEESDKYTSNSNDYDDTQDHYKEQQQQEGYENDENSIYSETNQPPQEKILITSKLYIIKSFGFDPEFLDYDKDEDDFIKKETTTTSTATKGKNTKNK
ncbi:hypothetical protein CYY_009103 [Polysphondylium violaceum]|uniref:Uncharacterized protein n=1 Tax=Polysphondylium violaceum TaxID=133409 RepID=A0A8J4PM52_9MYCE|nr:hypothetical protein CYY_009103 [Polysphondylium violaceum]